ncbi:hypothetical protein [Mesorhizobium sp. B263B2A]|uniref:hypothetical protein n=1 Tax=Mesorhizobium sp. B263B2A TaxID=2876669 RepID=UPI001CD124D4|nr:hypothetical protein [Mesorhizobium sp. B263B2A]MCA0032661.1 hypothetical protein [Mesorhizobium sp. B263B2A]
MARTDGIFKRGLRFQRPVRQSINATLGEKIPPRRVSRQRLNNSLYELILVRASQIEDGIHLNTIGRKESNLRVFFLSPHCEPLDYLSTKSIPVQRQCETEKDAADFATLPIFATLPLQHLSALVGIHLIPVG